MNRQSRMAGFWKWAGRVADLTWLAPWVIPPLLAGSIVVWSYFEKIPSPAIAVLAIVVFCVVLCTLVWLRRQRQPQRQVRRLFYVPDNVAVVELPWASPQELAGDQIIEKLVPISYVPRGPDHPCAIQGKKFIRCQLIGPSVLAMVRNTEIIECGFQCREHDQLFLEVEKEPRFGFIGPIGLIDCQFIGCEWKFIAFCGTKELLKGIRAGLVNLPPSAAPDSDEAS